LLFGHEFYLGVRAETTVPVDVAGNSSGPIMVGPVTVRPPRVKVARPGVPVGELVTFVAIIFATLSACFDVGFKSLICAFDKLVVVTLDVTSVLGRVGAIVVLDVPKAELQKRSR
jgi:hypothetical protein